MKLWGALAVLLCASQASALSCRQPNVAETFNQLQKSETVYSIAVGKFKITSKVPRYVAGKERKVKADFIARPMGLNGLHARKTIPVTVQTHCVADWCGGIPQDSQTEYLVFLRKSEAGNVVDTDACPSGIISVTRDALIDTLQRCLKQGECSASDIKRLESH